MQASEIVKEFQHIIDTEGDLVIDISVAKQPENEAVEQQQYLKAEARFIVVEEYENENPTKKRTTKRISIRDWPY